jgi:hypothetical protein
MLRLPIHKVYSIQNGNLTTPQVSVTGTGVVMLGAGQVYLKGNFSVHQINGVNVNLGIQEG